MKRILTLVLLAACNDVPQPEPPPPAKPKPAMSQQCTNTVHGFTVAYPDGWHTNNSDVLPACSTFDPAPIEIPRDSEIPFEIAIVIAADKVPFESMAADSTWEKVLSSQRLTLAGRQAVRAEVESTGEGLAERGMRTVRYAIDLGNGRSLIASTHKTDESYTANQEVLARMVETIVPR